MTTNGQALRWQNAPPAAADTHWVHQLKGGQRLKFCVYSPSLWGVWTHWIGSGTKPCYEDHSFCEGGHNEATLRWKAYVFGWNFELSKPTFCQLTDGGARNWLEQMAKGVSLRGQVIQVWRTPGKKGRMYVEVSEHVHRDPKTLPPDCDPEKSLLKLWKVADIIRGFHKSLVSGPDEIPGESKVG